MNDFPPITIVAFHKFA